MPNKILIVDDEEMLTELLSKHFQDKGYITYVANSGNEALEKLKNKPDIILLDINMPDMDGLTVCKNIRNVVSCPIIFLTARIAEQDIVNGLMMGGDDYVTKPFSLVALSARVEAHLRRETRKSNSSDFIADTNLIVNLSEKRVMYENVEINFSKKEFEIIEFFITNPNQVFDKEYIYERVWGFEAEGDTKVVKEHIRKIRNKLEKVTGKYYIETVWGMGYKWEK